MKYRTDFVTNSSSSSFTTVTVGFKNGENVTLGESGEHEASMREIDSLTIEKIKEVTNIKKFAEYLASRLEYFEHIREDEIEAEYDDDMDDDEVLEFIAKFEENAKSVSDIAKIDVKVLTHNWAEFIGDFQSEIYDIINNIEGYFENNEFPKLGEEDPEYEKTLEHWSKWLEEACSESVFRKCYDCHEMVEDALKSGDWRMMLPFVDFENVTVTESYTFDLINSEKNNKIEYEFDFY